MSDTAQQNGVAKNIPHQFTAPPLPPAAEMGERIVFRRLAELERIVGTLTVKPARKRVEPSDVMAWVAVAWAAVFGVLVLVSATVSILNQ